MNTLQQLYRESLTLLTDLYQLTMAYGYWKQNMHNDEAVFHLFFRKPPFKGQYAIAAGLHNALELIEQLQFSASDLDYLASLCGNDGQPLFEPAFLDYLSDVRFECDVHAVPEGTLMFGNEPLLRIQGSLLQCQLLETALLTIINFQTLIATKAARICQAADGDPVLDFGLRRAHGIDGGLSATRAAYIGGCAGSSNVLAGKLYGIPIKGTHAHSWVMSFPSELAAFEQYAASMPNNCIFLVDTYQTQQGVANAITVSKTLRERGHQVVGIRLDSGDLVRLSQYARAQLDAAGFTEAKIVASDELDEYSITKLKQQGACIDLWGVGTRLITSFDQPALGGVYKIAALRAPGGEWQYKLKLSEQAIKTSLPGVLQVRRFYNTAGRMMGDMVYDEHQAPSDSVPSGLTAQTLLQPMLLKGQRVAAAETLDTIRERVQAQLAACPPGLRALTDPEPYAVTLDTQLYLRQKQLIAQWV